MNDQHKPNCGDLVPAGRRDLAPVAAANPLVSRGIADLAQGRLRKATDGVPLELQDALSYYLRAMERADKEDYENAIKDLDQAIRLFDAAIGLDPTNAAAYLGRGKANYRRSIAFEVMEEDYSEETINYFDNAIKDFDDAIRLDPKGVSAYVERGEARAKSWGDAWTLDDGDKAIKDFGEAIKLDPNNALLYFSRARAWSRKKNYAKAITDYGEAIRLDPTNAHLYSNRGRLWMAQGHYDEAFKDFDDFIRHAPNNAYGYKNRANAWMGRKDHDKAIKDFDEAIRLDPNEAILYLNRGRAWCFKKDFGKAIKDFEQAIGRSPAFSSPYTSLAWLLATCPEETVRDGMGAIEMATKACQLNKWKSSFALDVLAAAYAEAGEFDEAQRYQKIALQDPRYRGPAGDEYRRRLELYKQKMPFRECT